MSSDIKTSGKVIFSIINQLPDKWWDDTSSVWTVWNKNSYYLWGANSMNYDLKEGDNLMGGGMAGLNGPTRGYAHDHYVGLDTMDYSDTRNPSVFSKLETLLASGNDIVVPIYKGCYSLGTGIAHQNLDWQKVQLQIMKGILDLINKASSTVVPDGTFWPDCRTQISVPDHMGGNRDCSICSRENTNGMNVGTTGVIVIKDVSDIKAIIAKLT